MIAEDQDSHLGFEVTVNFQLEKAVLFSSLEFSGEVKSGNRHLGTIPSRWEYKVNHEK